MEQYIIGRHPGSPLQIAPNFNAVSGQHARITISPSGEWTLEDLNSMNGTYVRDDEGNYQRVFRRQISESDIIRLGSGGANSFTCMARRVRYPDEPYQYEFHHLRGLLKKYKEQEARTEKKMERNGWISKLSGVGAIGLCAILGSIAGIDIDPNMRYLVIAFAPVVVGLFFAGQSKQLKALRSQRQKIMLCPKCGKPIPEFDIEMGQCSRCKAQ